MAAPTERLSEGWQTAIFHSKIRTDGKRGKFSTGLSSPVAGLKTVPSAV